MPTIQAGALANVFCPVGGSVTVTPAAQARVIVDDRDAGGAVAQIISGAQTFTTDAGGSIRIEAVGGSVTYTDAPISTTAQAASVQAFLASGDGIAGSIARAITLHDNPLTPATRGTLITDWSSGYTGAANTLDSSPVVGGSLAQLSNGSTSPFAAANAGAQSSSIRAVGFWAMASARSSGQAAAAFLMEFGTDSTFANNCFFSVNVPCDGKWHFLTSPAQVAWGTSGTFTIGTTNF